MKSIRLLIIFSLIAFSVASFSQGFIKTTVALTGNVFNEINKIGETCNIMVFDEDGNRVTATRSIGSQNGYYYLPGLKPGKKYQISLRKKGFMIETVELNVPNSSKYVELSQDFLIKPMKQGAKIPLSVSPFELNKSKLRVGSDIFLNTLKRALTNNETVNIKIISYPDNGKNPSENATLTSQRANSIKEWLVGQGIANSRLSTEGNKNVDPDNPPPTEKAAKGKRYTGPIYYEIVSF